MDEYLTLIKLAVIAGSFLLALLLESLILPQVLRIAYKKRLYDLPNARKVHKTPTPRLGGISFMPVIVIVLGLMAVARLRWVTDTVLSQNVTNQTMIYILFAMGLMLLYLIGAVDDLVGVSYRTKFVAQVIAAILPPVGGRNRRVGFRAQRISLDFNCSRLLCRQALFNGHSGHYHGGYTCCVFQV